MGEVGSRGGMEVAAENGLELEFFPLASFSDKL